MELQLNTVLNLTDKEINNSKSNLICVRGVEANNFSIDGLGTIL